MPPDELSVGDWVLATGINCTSSSCSLQPTQVASTRTVQAYGTCALLCGACVKTSRRRRQFTTRSRPNAAVPCVDSRPHRRMVRPTHVIREHRCVRRPGLVLRHVVTHVHARRFASAALVLGDVRAPVDGSAVGSTRQHRRLPRVVGSEGVPCHPGWPALLLALPCVS